MIKELEQGADVDLIIRYIEKTEHYYKEKEKQLIISVYEDAYIVGRLNEKKEPYDYYNILIFGK